MPRHSEVLILINIDRITVCFILKKKKLKKKKEEAESCRWKEHENEVFTHSILLQDEWWEKFFESFEPILQ